MLTYIDSAVMEREPDEGRRRQEISKHCSGERGPCNHREIGTRRGIEAGAQLRLNNGNQVGQLSTHCQHHHGCPPEHTQNHFGPAAVALILDHLRSTCYQLADHSCKGFHSIQCTYCSRLWIWERRRLRKLSYLHRS